MIGDDEVVGLQRVGLRIESEEFFAIGGLAHDDGAVELVEVEAMQRLAHLHHDVVRDVHDAVDGTQTDAFEATAQPLGAGADFDAFDEAGGVKRAGVFGFELDVGGVGFGLGGGVIALAFEGDAGEGAELAGEAEVAKEVGAIRRDFEVEEHVGGIQLVERRADGRIGGHDEQAAVIVAKAEFFAAAHHAQTRYVTQFAFFDGESSGQNGSRECERNFVARFEVLRAANDLSRGAAAIVDLADAEFIGIRMLHKGVDLSHDDLVGGHAAFFDALDLDTGEGEEIGELRNGVAAEIEMSAEPGEGDLHSWKGGGETFGFAAEGRRSREGRVFKVSATSASLLLCG